jgi:hypothetical protein
VVQSPAVVVVVVMVVVVGGGVLQGLLGYGEFGS